MSFRIVIIFLFLWFGQSFLFSQTGYFGKKSTFSIGVSGLPTITNTYAINPTSLEITRKKRFAFINYNSSFSYVISNKIEIDLCFTYSKVKAYTINTPYTTYEPEYDYWGKIKNHNVLKHPFLADPVFNYYRFGFSLKFYRLGSIAPIGKFIGFGVTIGNAKINNEKLYFGKRNIAAEKNRWKAKYTPYSLNTIQLAFRIGRNYAINKAITFGYEWVLPILTISTQEYGYGEIGYYWEIQPYYAGFEDSALTDIFNKSIQKHSFVRFKTTLQFHF